MKRNRSVFQKQIISIALSAALSVTGLPAAVLASEAESEAETGAEIVSEDGTLTEEVSASGKESGDDLDYLGAKYNLDDHIYDAITIDRLDLLLDAEEYPGKSIVVFADVLSDTAQAAVPEINAQAQALGIEKIYYFDLLLAGEYGVNIWDDPEAYWPVAATEPSGESEGTEVTQAFVEAKNYLVSETALKDVPEEFTAADDVYLFVLDDETTDGETEKVITAGTLIQDADNLPAEEIAEVLGTVVEDGVSTATAYTDFDYFNDDVWKDDSNGEFYEDYSEYEDNFKLRSVTYYELRYLLEQEGQHNILVAGSWCSDGHLALPFIIEDSSVYDSDTIYVFDFRLTNSVQTNRQTSILSYEGYYSESRDFISRVGYLGEPIIEAFGTDYKNGGANTTYQYVENGEITITDGVAEVTYTTTSGAAFRSPFLIKYDKDADTPVVDAWLHEVQDWEIPYTDTEYEEGTLVDYELSSGPLSNTQKALGRYELAVFLGAKELEYSPATITISEADSALDSGCGDDNDPIDNLGQETLIPNQGTILYDVSHYDIDIELIEAKSQNAEDATFEGTTVITGTALDTLDGQIIFDFRRQEIEEITVANVTTGTEYEGISWQQYNDDDQDLQKLIVSFDGTIETDEEFEVSVSYKTYTIDYSVAELGSPQGFSVHTDGQGYTAIGEPFGATYWFPGNNTPADGATYTITLRAPIGYTTVSNGVRTAKVDAGADGKATTTWEVTQETAGYQIFAAFSTNLYELESFSSEEEIYTTADGRELPLYTCVNKDSYKENRYAVDRFYGLLPYYISTLESLYGAYPGEALGFVFENVGDGTGGSATWGAVETKDRPFYTSTRVTGENTFVHEFAHQWYGDAVRLNDWKSLWLNEGFATYGSDLYYETIGAASSDGETFSAYQKYYDLWNDTDDSSALWAAAPADILKESDLFGGAKVAYNRGALALAVLRDGVGDEVFFEILQGWLTEGSGRANTTEDFITYAEQISELDLTAFADAWLYGTEKPAAFTLSGTEN